MTEWNADGYHHVNSLQQWLAEESLAQLPLEGNESVLDVGCGDGRVTAEIAERVPRGRVLGVDPSQQMIEYARKTYARDTLRFERGDARSLELPERFDRVVSFNALHWVPLADFPRALQNLHQALKRDGAAHFRFVGLGERTSLEAVIEATYHQKGHRPPYTHLTPEEYRRLAAGAGFRIRRLELLDTHWDFPSREKFVEWARVTFVEWTRSLPDPDAFIAQVLENYARITGEPNRFAFYQMVSDLQKGT